MVWAECWQDCLPDLLKRAYTKSDDDEYVYIDGRALMANTSKMET
jgi:hypothetical protein